LENTSYQVNREDYSKTPPILFVPINNLRITIASQSIYTGAFRVENKGGTPLKGKVFSKKGYAEFTPENFNSAEWKDNVQVIIYRIDSKNMFWGNTYEDTWIIESNGGEQEISNHIGIKKPMLIIDETNSVSSLEEFTEFAKNNWERANEIFCSPGFLSWLYQSQNLEYVKIYNQIIIISQKDWALEYFLRLTNNKQPPTIWIEDDIRKVELSPKDKRPNKKGIILHKKGWGLIDIELETNESWIKLSKSIFTAQDFKENKLIIEYEIIPNKIKNKINFGYIKIHHEDMESTYKVIVTQKQVFNISLSKKSYKQDDVGVLIIENETGKDAMVHIFPKDSWIGFEAKKYLISKKAEIPFRVRLTGWDKWGMNKEPYCETIIELMVSNKKYRIKDSLVLKVDRIGLGG